MNSQMARKKEQPMNLKKFNFKQLAWASLTVIFSISLILSFITAYNYTEIAKARILADVSTEAIPHLIYDDAGFLEKVNITIEFTVNNPSQRVLKVWILNYKGWIRDMPLEDGVDDSRWMVDGKLSVNEVEQRYYPIFTTSYSFDSPDILVQSESSIIITKYLELSMEIDSTIMSNFISIHDYTRAIGQEMEWYLYSSSILFINDIPAYSGPDNTANVIRRFQGHDLTPGVGGVGP